VKKEREKCEDCDYHGVDYETGELCNGCGGTGWFCKTCRTPWPLCDCWMYGDEGEKSDDEETGRRDRLGETNTS